MTAASAPPILPNVFITADTEPAKMPPTSSVSAHDTPTVSSSPNTASANHATLTSGDALSTPAGIATAAQDRLHFAAFDLDASATRDDLRTLLEDWTSAAARLTQGLDVTESGAVGGSAYAPPDDTGEALGLPPSGLTITFGLGP